MKKLFWLASGVAAGLLLAKKIEQDPVAKAKFDEFLAKAKDITAAATEGFNERSTELEVEREKSNAQNQADETK
jgi:hypothetical protein